MHKPLRIVLSVFLFSGLIVPAATAQNAASIRGVRVLGGANNSAVEVEIESTDNLLPQTQVLTGPDRLVVDFHNTTPGPQLRNQLINRGEVKTVRIGLLQSNPPVTRVVLDLKSAQSYQVFPHGRTVTIKVTGEAHATEAQAQPPVRSKDIGKNKDKVQITETAKETAKDAFEDFPPVTRPGLVVANYVASAERVQSAAPAKMLDVNFRDGMLSIKAMRATLSEVLFAVHQRTGAEVAISAGAEQEIVVADIGPAPAPEVLARLLNGSKFNYLILNSPKDPRVLERVILSPRSEGAITPLPPVANNSGNDDQADDDPPPPPPRRVRPVPPPQQDNDSSQPQPPNPLPQGHALPGAQSEIKPPADADNNPD